MPGRMGKVGREENGKSEIKKAKSTMTYIKIMIAMSTKRLCLAIRCAHLHLQKTRAHANSAQL